MVIFHNIAFLGPEDLNKDILQSFPVIFDVKILLKKCHARQATITFIMVGLEGSFSLNNIFIMVKNDLSYF